MWINYDLPNNSIEIELIQVISYDSLKKSKQKKHSVTARKRGYYTK